MIGLRLASLLVVLTGIHAVAADRQPLAPHAPAVVREEVVQVWDFAASEQGWPVMTDATADIRDGALHITSSGVDPMLRVPCGEVVGPLRLEGRIKTSAQGPVEIYWATREAPNMGSNGSVRISVPADGQWHPFRAEFRAAGHFMLLRFDPCTQPGEAWLDDVKLTRVELHPLQFESIDGPSGRIRNRSDKDLDFRTWPEGPIFHAPAGGIVNFTKPLVMGQPFNTHRIAATADGVPPLVHTSYFHNEAEPLNTELAFGNSNVLVQVAEDGSGARFFYRGQLAAIASPLAETDGTAVVFSGAARRGQRVELAGEGGLTLAISLDGDDFVFDLSSPRSVAGPSIRVPGVMKEGLLAGVEYLEQGDTSSSELDIEREEHLRFEPDPMLITMPLAAYVTDRGSAAMLWEDMTLQPVFSSPNRYDLTPDHLMRLKGRTQHFRLRLGPTAAQGARLDDAILWAVAQRGLPELPAAPRTPEAQMAFNRATFDGSLRTTNGWYHATWPGNPQQFFVDHASSVFRLDGRMPDVPQLVNGGAHIANPAAWLVSGRAGDWLAHLKADAERARKQQQLDGSFQYTGKYQRGHFDTTASGYCAVMALPILDHAYYTGDAASRDAGLKALDYMKRFVTPRGAQIWEMPLHTPDLLAAAKCSMAFLRGYALTGRADYLDEARRWAIRGIPFVYQWGNQPIMRYATTAVLGATDWTGVVWIGLPVQWCGTVYAYALLDLAAVDHTVDWTKLARGLLLCAEQMQYPDGPYAGTLPDSFNLIAQRRLPAYVNPCALVSLRLRLSGQLDGVAVATVGAHRVAAPFPVRLENDRAIVDAPAGQKFQVVIDGQRIVNGEGPSSLPLNAAP